MSLRWLLAMAAAAACGKSNNARPDATPDVAADAAIVSMTIGPAGGTVSLGNGPSVQIPANALDSPTTISISVSAQPAPADAVTPLYDFAPDGIVFAQPVTVTFPVVANAQNASLYWSKHGATGFDRVGGTAGGGGLSAQITHFSSGYAAPTAGGRTVSGTEVVTFIRPGGITNQAIDLSALAPRVLVPDGSGGFTTLTGAGAADGTFHVDNVPDGDVYLQLGTETYVTSAAAFDGGYELPGRPDAIATTDGATSITLNLTGLSSWTAGDVLEAYSAEVDTWWFGLQIGYPPMAGATALSGYTFLSTDGGNSRRPPFSQGPQLVQASKGDNFAVAQLTQRQSSEGVPYLAMSEYFNTSSLEETDGGMQTVSGAFTDVSATNTVSMTFLTTQYDGAAGWNGTNAVAINPGAIPMPSALRPGTGPEFGIIGIPGGSQYGEYSNSADFLYLQVANGTQDTTATNMTYGSPAVGTWAAIVDARDQFKVPVQATGATGPGYLPAAIGESDEIANVIGAPIGCSMTPVRAPTVGGADAWSSPTGVGLTPVIAWQPPQQGIPSQYGVGIYEAKVGPSGNAKVVYVGALHTTQTSVQVPPGMLVAGHQYAFEINANRNANQSFDAPNRFRLSSHHAQIVSSVFAP